MVRRAAALAGATLLILTAAFWWAVLPVADASTALLLCLWSLLCVSGAAGLVLTGEACPVAPAPALVLDATDLSDDEEAMMREHLVKQMERQAAEEPLAGLIDALADEALKLALNIASELEGIEQNSAAAMDVRYAYLREVSVALDGVVTALTQAQAKAALRGYVERRRSTRLTVARVLPAK